MLKYFVFNVVFNYHSRNIYMLCCLSTLFIQSSYSISFHYTVFILFMGIFSSDLSTGRQKDPIRENTAENALQEGENITVKVKQMKKMECMWGSGCHFIHSVFLYYYVFGPHCVSEIFKFKTLLTSVCFFIVF